MFDLKRAMLLGSISSWFIIIVSLFFIPPLCIEEQGSTDQLEIKPTTLQAFKDYPYPYVYCSNSEMGSTNVVQNLWNFEFFESFSKIVKVPFWILERKGQLTLEHHEKHCEQVGVFSQEVEELCTNKLLCDYSAL